jgi:lipopolysaccharide transport system ATP-binding protein
MPPIIRVENLGKKYTLRHQGDGHGGYRRFSEELLHAFKRPFRRGNRHVPDGRTNEEFWALRNVSFDVQQGEALGIIGRNGAGKSTLLKILSRITEPTEGRVRLNGRVASLLEVGTGFHPELTGRENIFLNGAVLGMSRAEIRKKFDEIVAFAEVEKFIDTPVKRYSSGMYVRLAFSIAAHLEPEILVVDEVLAVGDQAFQRKCLGKLSGVADSGMTVLFVSHNTAALQALCPRCVLLNEGCILADCEAIAAISEYCQMLSQVYATPISERNDRTGSGKARLVNLRLLGVSGQQVSVIPMGEDWVLELTYQCDEPIARPLVGMAIATLTGQRVTRILTSETDCTLTDFHGRVRLRCRVPKVNLVPGDYQVTCDLSELHGETIDRVECAMVTKVIASDVLGSTHVSDLRNSLCFFPAFWSCDVEATYVS